MCEGVSKKSSTSILLLLDLCHRSTEDFLNGELFQQLGRNLRWSSSSSSKRLRQALPGVGCRNVLEELGCSRRKNLGTCGLGGGRACHVADLEDSGRLLGWSWNPAAEEKQNRQPRAQRSTWCGKSQVSHPLLAEDVVDRFSAHRSEIAPRSDVRPRGDDRVCRWGHLPRRIFKNRRGLRQFIKRPKIAAEVRVRAAESSLLINVERYKNRIYASLRSTEFVTILQVLVSKT